MNKLKEKGRYLEPLIRIGKKGLTDEVIKEIAKQLKKKKLIKIKFLKSFLEKKDRKEVAREVTEKTNSKIIEQVGFVVVLSEKSNSKTL